MIRFGRRWTWLAVVPSSVLTLALAGCGLNSRTAIAPKPDPVTLDSSPTAPEGAGSHINDAQTPPDSETNTGGAIIRRAQGDVVGRVKSQAEVDGTTGDITLNYVDTDIREIVRVILGDILKVNYAIDPGYQGTATIHTARPLRREELLPTLQQLVAQAGGFISYENGVFRVGPQGNDNIIPPVLDGGGALAGSQVVTLRYASAKQLVAMLEPYVGEGAQVIADRTRNVLIVRGTASARQNLIDLIKLFDVDYLSGQSYALFPVKTGDPNKLAADLQKALQLDSNGPLDEALRVIALDQANAIMVIARRQSYLDRASRLLDDLQSVIASSGRTIHVIYLKNVQAADLQPVLQRAVNPPAGGGGGETGPGSLPPTATPAVVAAPAAGNAAAPPGAQPQAAPATPPASTTQAGGTQPPANAPPPLPTPVETEAQGQSGFGPQIIADSKINALLVVATASEFASVEAAVRKLDVLPMQVLIEATVAEVTLNDELQFGAQYFLSHGSFSATLSNAQSPTPTAVSTPAAPITNAELFPGTLAPNFPGFAIAQTVGTAQFAIEALKSVTDVKIVSSPKLLILDNQKATLQVGDLVPIITQSAESVSAAGAPIVNNVQYQSTGVILNVTPQINSGGLVTLDIGQEVSDVVATTSSTINSPTFEQRKVQSKVSVQDGQTISLAGLISDTTEKDTSGIPLLSDIPVVGNLFSTHTNTTQRTELLILITPHIVHDERDARTLTEELRRKLAPASGLAP